MRNASVQLLLLLLIVAAAVPQSSAADDEEDYGGYEEEYEYRVVHCQLPLGWVDYLVIP